MLYKRTTSMLLIGSMGLGLVPLGGCENMPGTPKEQGAVIGGASGAAAGALIAKNNRLLGGLIGGAPGAGGGNLVGANWDKIKGKKKDDAVAAPKRPEANPPAPAAVRNPTT